MQSKQRLKDSHTRCPCSSPVPLSLYLHNRNVNNLTQKRWCCYGLGPLPPSAFAHERVFAVGLSVFVVASKKVKVFRMLDFVGQ
jgi:hypothetical protein